MTQAAPPLLRAASGRRGMALILASGLAALLLLVATALLGAARLAARGAASRSVAAEAALAVESGLEYAGARLDENPWPLPRDAWSPSNACDDWSCRDFSRLAAGPPGARSLNPSYNRGEGWTDLDSGGNGIYEPGLDDFADRNENGRYDARSGRIRTAGAPAAFSLRILSEAALACVNSGELCAPDGDQDLDGVLNEQDADFAIDRNMDAQGQLLGNGVPDWRDPDYIGNRHIVNLLDNLGAILKVSTTHEELYWPDDNPSSPVLGWIETSSLGRQIVSARPRGGYTSVEQIKTVLGEADYALAAPFLSVHGEIVPIPFQHENYGKDEPGEHLLSAPESRYEFHARIDFNNAPVELILASLRYLSVSGGGSEDGTEWGSTFFRFHTKEESDTVAQILADNRPIWTWREFLRTLADKIPASTWQRDPFYQGAEELLILEGEGLPLLKQEMILAQFDANWLLPDPFTWRRNTWEVDREPNVYRGVDKTRIVQPTKEYFTGFLSTSPFDDAGEPNGHPITTLPNRMTTEHVLTPHKSVYRIACGGWIAGASGAAGRETALAFGGEPFRATSQNDFEQMDASPAAPWRYPGGEVSAVSPAWRHGIQTTPRFPFRSPQRRNYPPTATTSYPRAYGGLQLAARQMDMSDLTAPGCTFALPFNEDGEPATGNRWSPDDWFDNVADPVERLPARDQYFIHRYLYDQGAWPSPAGQRNTYAMSVTWGGTVPFGGVGANGVSEGTIAFWYAQTGTNENEDWFQTSLAPRTVMDFWYPYGTGYVYYLGVSNDNHTGKIKVDNSIDSLSWRGYLTEAPEAALAKATWHHAAVTFHPGGAGGTAIKIYVDGRLADPVTDEDGKQVSPPLPIATDPARPPDANGLKLFLRGPLDDLLLFSTSLSPDAILEMARKPRFYVDPSSTGTDPPRYRSPRFRFDPDRFPEGAVLSGATWEAFIPEATGGSFTFEITGYNGNDDPIGSSGPILYDGTQIPQARFRLTGCRSFDFQVWVDTDPAAWPLLEDQPVLRDTPILEEFRVLYGPPRPRWMSYAAE